MLLKVTYGFQSMDHTKNNKAQNSFQSDQGPLVLISNEWLWVLVPTCSQEIDLFLTENLGNH